MNCNQVQELLPLYVGCDLEEKRANLVAAHLQSCSECDSSAKEYRETRQLLQQFAPPPFSEAVYAGIRRRVLREIARESTKSTLPQSVASFFRPRFRFAVATALLIAVSVFAFYFIANQRNDRQRLAGRGAVDQATRREQADAQSQLNKLAVSPSPSSPPKNEPPLTSTVRNKGADRMIAGSLDRTHQPPRRKSFGPAADRTSSVAKNTTDARSITAEASREVNNLAPSGATPARDQAAVEKTLRLEMQTSDPNIRIIWFSNQRTKQDSPGKFSKST